MSRLSHSSPILVSEALLTTRVPTSSTQSSSDDQPVVGDITLVHKTVLVGRSSTIAMSQLNLKKRSAARLKIDKHFSSVVAKAQASEVHITLKRSPLMLEPSSNFIVLWTLLALVIILFLALQIPVFLFVAADRVDFSNVCFRAVCARVST